MTDSQTAQRKLLTTGRYTYTLTLPKAWVRKLRWREKQLLQLELKADGIVVTDFPNRPRKEGK